MEPASFKFSDDVMFNRVMSIESICRRVLEGILGVSVKNITYQNTQQEARSGVFARGIRMDVYLEGDGAVYDVEMQAHSEPCIARRFRYYQSMIDSGTLAKGDDYDLLPESYVIFLCREDPFGRGLPVYGVERRCVQDEGCEVPCGSHWIALNASAWERAEPGLVRDLLQYVENGSVCEEDALIQDIDEAVQTANNDSRWVDNYFSVSTIEENAARRVRIRAREAEREGMAKGMAEGKAAEAARYNKLVAHLAAEGRLEELAQAVSADDPGLLDSLFNELS